MFMVMKAMHIQIDQQTASDVRHACLLEATARKPGNVHPWASFVDMTYADFTNSIAAVESAMLTQPAMFSIGQFVLATVQATRKHVGKNTNLGILLLVAPLLAVPADQRLCDGIEDVLRNSTIDDSRQVYQAIRTAQPGGMGAVQNESVDTQPTLPLRNVMQLAADRDGIASQYANSFRDILDFGLPILAASDDWPTTWETDIIRLHLTLMAKLPDTLIARKCGWELAAESANRAKVVLESGWPDTEYSQQQFRELDTWLRADGHRRNPGTSADLVAATLFAALREKRLQPVSPEQIETHLSSPAQRTINTECTS